MEVGEVYKSQYLSSERINEEALLVREIAKLQVKSIVVVPVEREILDKRGTSVFLPWEIQLYPRFQ